MASAEAVAFRRGLQDKDGEVIGYFECCHCGYHSPWASYHEVNGGTPCRKCGHRCDAPELEFPFADFETVSEELMPPPADLEGCVLYLYQFDGPEGLSPSQILRLITYVDEQNLRWTRTIFARCCRCNMISKDPVHDQPHSMPRTCKHCTHPICQGCQLARAVSGDTLDWHHHVTFNELKNTFPDRYFCTCAVGIVTGWQKPKYNDPKFGNLDGHWATNCCTGTDGHGRPFDMVEQCVRFYDAKPATQRFQDHKRLSKSAEDGLYLERLEARPAAILFGRNRWAFQAGRYDGPAFPRSLRNAIPRLLPP